MRRGMLNEDVDRKRHNIASKSFFEENPKWPRRGGQHCSARGVRKWAPTALSGSTVGYGRGSAITEAPPTRGGGGGKNGKMPTPHGE